MKYCSRGHGPLEDEDFWRDAQAKDGLSSQCKSCTKERRAASRYAGNDWFFRGHWGPRRRYSNATMLIRDLRGVVKLPDDLKINVCNLLGLTPAEAKALWGSPFKIRRSRDQIQADLYQLVEDHLAKQGPRVVGRGVVVRHR